MAAPDSCLGTISRPHPRRRVPWRAGRSLWAEETEIGVGRGRGVWTLCSRTPGTRGQNRRKSFRNLRGAPSDLWLDGKLYRQGETPERQAKNNDGGKTRPGS